MTKGGRERSENLRDKNPDRQSEQIHRARVEEGQKLRPLVSSR